MKLRKCCLTHSSGVSLTNFFLIPSKISRFAVSEAKFYQVFFLADERDRKLAGRAAPLELGGAGVEQSDGGRQRLPVHLEAWVAVRDVEGAPRSAHAFASVGVSPGAM